jgi:hypothetical protein
MDERDEIRRAPFQHEFDIPDLEAMPDRDHQDAVVDPEQAARQRWQDHAAMHRQFGLHRKSEAAACGDVERGVVEIRLDDVRRLRVVMIQPVGGDKTMIGLVAVEQQERSG